MGFARGKHASTADRPKPRNRRREHLTALHTALRARRDMAVSLVSQRGVSWVNIALRERPRQAVDVGCDYRSGDWWFCRVVDGATIARADDVTGCITAIAQSLGRV
ncbi:hypothetical protein [Actinomadura keratinilytica]|uniref:Transposase n=1 Tax=Actinomadura keratinilytica TaxID=547461 RepID=A0ABP7ZCL7_9ACTN